MSKIKRKDIPSASKAEGILTFQNAYLAYKEECAAFERTWHDGTQVKYDGHINKLIVPHLRNHDHTPIHDYTLDDFKHVIDELRRVGQHNNPDKYKPYADSTLGKVWHIMKTVVTVTSDHESFHNVFDESEKDQQTTEAHKIQQMKELWLIPKSLSVKEEKKVLEYILRNLDKRGEYAALFLSLCLGLRLGESSSINFGFITEMAVFPGHYYLKVPQSTMIHSNRTKVEMKTYNAYRNIPLPQLAVEVLFYLREKRIHRLQKISGDVTSIDNAPIAYRGKRESIRCSADAVSAEARKMFGELGLRGRVEEIDAYLQQDASVVEEEQVDVDEFALVEKDASAYLLRRNFASALAILQLSDAELTYILGHVIEDSQAQRSDFLDERELFAIKQKMDRRPLLNQVGLPRILLEGNATVQTINYNQEFVMPPEARRIKLTTAANEPNDPIHVTVTLANGATIREEVGIQGVPFPHHFANSTDVLKAYHAAYLKYSDESHPSS